MEKASDALIKGFIDDLLFGFFDKAHPLYHNPRVMAAINACIEMHRTIAEQRLSKHLAKLVRDQVDSEFLSGAVLVPRIIGAWAFLDNPAQEKVVELVRKGKATDVIKVLAELARIDALKPEIAARIASLTVQELGAAIGLYRLRDLAKGRALQLLSEVRSWASANEVIDKVILPLFGLLDRTDIDNILRFPSETSADLFYSGGLAKLIERVRQAKLFKPSELNDLLKDRGAGYLVPEEVGEDLSLAGDMNSV